MGCFQNKIIKIHETLMDWKLAPGETEMCPKGLFRDPLSE